ncbi:MAG TPA: hypothetical protein VE575_13050, partial [Acidimicrobiales bacterium]|nr:hypothetical protein [Acidimicrobiales bacterium]
MPEVGPVADVSPAPEPSGEPTARAGRRATGWDLLGLSVTALGMLGIRQVAVVAIAAPLGQSRRVFLVAAVVGAVVS